MGITLVRRNLSCAQASTSVSTSSHQNLDNQPYLTFHGVFYTLTFDGGGLILATLFLSVKTIEKVDFWDFFFFAL